MYVYFPPVAESIPLGHLSNEQWPDSLVENIAKQDLIQPRHPQQQIRPAELRVRLDKDEPFLVRPQLDVLLHHGQELPLVEIPRLLADGIVQGYARGAAVLDRALEVEVGVSGFCRVADVGQRVVDGVGLDVLRKVGED